MENEINLDQLLNSYLSDGKEDRIINARHLLGDINSYYKDDQIEALLADFEYLADKWLDEFERNILNGKTLIDISK